MSTVTNLAIGPVKFITDADGPTSLAAIQTNGSLHRLTLEDLGDLSEFIATAWLNISGKEYGAGFEDHVDSVAFYSGDESLFSRFPALRLAESDVERDCE